MGAFICQGCGIGIDYTGPGRPRFCDLCRPVRYDAVRRCPHGLPTRGTCEPCAWAKAFWARRQPPRVSGGRMHFPERRRLLERALADANAARKTEVAAVRALDLPDAEREERLTLVRDQIRTEISDLRGELRELRAKR